MSIKLPNGWYAIASSKELSGGRSKGIKFLGQNIVLWRTSSGVSGAIDRCPHRSARLSDGRVINDKIECPYHGLQFNSQGACELIPEIGKGSKGHSLQLLDIREKGNFVWCYQGADASASEIQWFTELDQAGFVESNFQWQQHFSRSIENQLDLAHLPIVHRKSIGKYFKYDLLKTRYEQWEHGIKIHWSERSSFHDADLELLFPNLIRLKVNANYFIVFAIVPESETATRFYQRSYSRFFKNPLLKNTIGHLIRSHSKKIFHEDRSVVISQEPGNSILAGEEKLLASDHSIRLFRDWLRNVK